MTASRLETTATISLEKLPDGFAITKSHLDLVAQVPGADKAKFDAAVKAAETGCPVSKLFKAEISDSARLASYQPGFSSDVFFRQLRGMFMPNVLIQGSNQVQCRT